MPRHTTALCLLVAVAGLLCLATGLHAEERPVDPETATLSELDALGLRRIQARRSGITVLHPQAWTLTSFQRGSTAFSLRLPQDHPRDPAGALTCTLAPAPDTLADLDARLAAGFDVPPEHTLLQHKIISAGEKSLPVRLECTWSWTRPGAGNWYTLQSMQIVGRHLYTLTLQVDEAHLEAWRADFQAMLKTARFNPVDTAVERLGEGVWLQPQYGFSLQLPEFWEPALGASEKTLLFATGRPLRSDAESLSVRAAPAADLQLAERRVQRRAAIEALGDDVELLACELVERRRRPVLVTRYRDRRNGRDLTVVQYEFALERLQYECLWSIPTPRWGAIAAEIEARMATFCEHELPVPRNPS